MATTSPLLSSRKKDRRKKKILRWLLVSGILLCVIAGGLVYISRLAQFQISAFNISGTTPADDAAIRSYVADAASGSYLYAFPKSDIFLYPAGAVREDILAKFPEVKSVTVDRSDLQTIEVVIEEKKPVAIWCGDAPLASSSSPCLFLDQGGEAYKEAPQFSVSPYFQYFGALSSSTLPAAFLPQEKFSKLGTLVSSLSGVFPASSVYHTPDDDFEISDLSGTILKIPEKADYSEILRYLKAFIAGQGIGPAAANPDKYDYIDLRFGKKIYYKLKGVANAPGSLSSPAVHNVPVR